LQTNLALMCNDICQAHDEALNESHHGHPTIVEVVHTGQPGRPAIVIDPDFLCWAYSLKETQCQILLQMNTLI